MLNFADVAKKKVEDVERPPLPPIGTYRWTVTKIPEVTTSKDDKWDFLTFPVKVIEALEDVDTEDYKGAVTSIVNRVQFIFNKEDQVAFDQTMFRVRTFLEKHLQVADAGMSVSEALNASVGSQFLGTIGYRQDKNDTTLQYAEISKTAPLD